VYLALTCRAGQIDQIEGKLDYPSDCRKGRQDGRPMPQWHHQQTDDAILTSLDRHGRRAHRDCRRCRTDAAAVL
jgi:hypothetical protein